LGIRKDENIFATIGEPRKKLHEFFKAEKCFSLIFEI